jgi:type I restriction enzyme S subunit
MNPAFWDERTIPRHWTQKKLKYVASLQSGDTISPEAIRDKGEFPVYGGNGFRGYTSAYTHSGDYVLIGRQGALCGNVNYASNKFWASEHAIVADTKGKANVRWLGELLRALRLRASGVVKKCLGLWPDLRRRLFPQQFDFKSHN